MADRDSTARLRYRLTHWGTGGPIDRPRILSAADPHIPSTELGELVRVVYRTKKIGDGGLADYHHKFVGPRPVLAYHEGGLLILGGGYRVTWRGIVG